MSNINEFLSQFSDIGRQNMYRVRISAPWMDTNFLSFMCFSAKLPFHTYSPVESHQNKKNKKFSTRENLDPVSLSFYVDTDGKILEFCRTWMRRVRGANGDWNFKNEYVATVTIELLDANEISYFTGTLIDAQVVNIDVTDLSWQNTNGMVTATVNLIYDDVDYS